MIDENLQPINQTFNVPSKKKKLILIFTASLIVIVVMLVFVSYIRGRINKNKSAIMEINKEKLLKEQYDKNLKQTYLTDKDFDGISDAEEKKYGTSPTSSDTDIDGILDRDEINVYKTNPLKSDTDGDGFQDGDEVRRGYDPKVAGTL